jgi:TolA-binding protein
MKAIRAFVSVAMVMCTAPATLSAADVVASISGMDGPVFVDAFGTGVFIEAILGESLYAESVVKTGYGGSAKIDVGGKITELAPESMIAITDLLETREKKKRFRWLSSIANAVKSVFRAAKGDSEDVVLGGRASRVDEAEVGWITDDEDEDAFSDAMTLVDEEQWSEAVALLREIVDPLPGTFLPGEIGFWIGHCQYQLENYREARSAYSDSLLEIESEAIDPWSLPYYEEALFQSGSSAYFTEEFSAAIDAMEELIPKVSEEYKPYTYMVLIDSLRETGATAAAKRYLANARSQFAGSEYASGFDELAKELN